MSNEIALRDQGGALAAPQEQWNAEMKEVIRSQLCPDASDEELVLFELTARRLGLDPFAKQVYLVKRWNAQAKRNVAQVQVGIDGMRLAAQRTGRYRGQRGPFWCGDDGVWVDVWLKATPPAAARVEVLHRDFPEPLAAVATWSQYAQTTKDGEPTAMWRRMPALMLAKCAESLALRKAFPAEFSGVYTTEEMLQDDPAPQSLPPAQIPAGTSVTDKVPVWRHRAEKLLEMGEREVVIGAMQEAGISAQQLADDATWERAQDAVKEALLFPPVDGEVVPDGQEELDLGDQAAGKSSGYGRDPS